LANDIVICVWNSAPFTAGHDFKKSGLAVVRFDMQFIDWEGDNVQLSNSGDDDE